MISRRLSPGLIHPSAAISKLFRAFAGENFITVDKLHENFNKRKREVDELRLLSKEISKNPTYPNYLNMAKVN